MLTANILACNAERWIARCLTSIADFVDEIVIGLDDKTVDGTMSVIDEFRIRWPARELNVIPFHLDGFDSARNMLIENSREPWILSIDSDEEIAPGDGPRIRQLLKDVERAVVGPVEAIELNTRNWMDLERKEEFPDFYPEPHVRIFRNLPQIHWHGNVHERVWGWQHYVNPWVIDIHHFNRYYRTPEDWERVNQFYKTLGST